MVIDIAGQKLSFYVVTQNYLRALGVVEYINIDINVDERFIVRIGLMEKGVGVCVGVGQCTVARNPNFSLIVQSNSNKIVTIIVILGLQGVGVTWNQNNVLERKDMSGLFFFFFCLNNI